MAELGQDRRVPAVDLRCAEPEQPACQPRVDDVHLRVSGEALAKRLAPGRQSLDHEGRLEKGGVPVRGAAFQPCRLPGLRDVEQLTGLRRELTQQPG
jgi:hypothetical protein